MKHIEWLFAFALVFAWIGCASPTPRVGEVDGTKHTENIDRVDHALYVADRASHLHVQVTPLPTPKQSQEYNVAWNGTGISLVKFEYRQVNVPDKIIVQSVSPASQHSHVFTIVGQDFVDGGPVSAWRVSLWDGDKLLTERESVLW
jgi:hypothetical protein